MDVSVVVRHGQVRQVLWRLLEMEVDLDVVPLPKAEVSLMSVTVPEIELVVETVQLVHCCRIPWIVFEALQLVCLFPHKFST